MIMKVIPMGGISECQFPAARHEPGRPHDEIYVRFVAYAGTSAMPSPHRRVPGHWCGLEFCITEKVFAFMTDSEAGTVRFARVSRQLCRPGGAREAQWWPAERRSGRPRGAVVAGREAQWPAESGPCRPGVVVPGDR